MLLIIYFGSSYFSSHDNTIRQQLYSADSVAKEVCAAMLSSDRHTTNILMKPIKKCVSTSI